MSGPSAPIRVLVADDHWVVRTGMQLYFRDDDSVVVVGEASNGAEAIDRTRELRPDVVLMDLLMPEVSGTEAIAAIKAECPQVEVIALTSVLQDRSVSEAIRAGAAGYVLKDGDGGELVQAIHAAVEGKVYLSPAAATRLAQEMRSVDRIEHLTRREVEILRLVAGGLANKEIARTLAITEKTVKVHLNSVFSKLDVRSRTQAALYAIRTGIAELDTDDDAQGGPLGLRP